MLFNDFEPHGDLAKLDSEDVATCEIKHVLQSKIRHVLQSKGLQSHITKKIIYVLYPDSCSLIG